MFIVGLIAIVIGIALLSIPLAWIVGGGLCVAVSVVRMIAVARTESNGS
jgi:membrane protein implicated in regulation of membrane protease activity